MVDAPIKLVLADVDGTLVTPAKELTERCIAAVRKLAEANIAFAITSGRPPRGLMRYVEPLALRTPIAGFNGGMIVKPDMTPIEVKTIPPELVPKMVRGAIARGIDPWLFRIHDWRLREPRAPHAEREARTIGFPAVVTPDLESNAERYADGVVKVVGVSDDLELLACVEEEMRERFTDHVSAARSQPYYLDVTHPDANKGAVFRRLSRELGIPYEAIATLGDMPNDILMFADAGVSIAMGQSSEEVKRSARRVTRSNTEDGFAAAIERYVLRAA